MSEQVVAVPPRRTWLTLSTLGVALITIAMIVVALVIADKTHFGWLVGTMFLPVITSGVIAGSVLLLVGALNLPKPRTWRTWVLVFWAIVALTSPLFGIMFLLPWGALVLTLPLVIMSLVAFRRR